MSNNKLFDYYYFFFVFKYLRLVAASSMVIQSEALENPLALHPLYSQSFDTPKHSKNKQRINPLYFTTINF